MTREEARNYIIRHCNPDYPRGKTEWETAINMAINALEIVTEDRAKAIPPKFVEEDRYIKNHFQTYPHCPKCNYDLETGDCYCRVCGCHIDWSEDDE